MAVSSLFLHHKHSVIDCCLNLQLDYLFVDFNGECTELHSNRHLMFQLKLLVHDSGKEATFTDTRITNNDLFKEVILCRQLLVMDHLIWD